MKKEIHQRVRRLRKTRYVPSEISSRSLLHQPNWRLAFCEIEDRETRDKYLKMLDDMIVMVGNPDSKVKEHLYHDKLPLTVERLMLAFDKVLTKPEAGSM